MSDLILLYKCDYCQRISMQNKTGRHCAPDGLKDRCKGVMYVTHWQEVKR